MNPTTALICSIMFRWLLFSLGLLPLIIITFIIPPAQAQENTEPSLNFSMSLSEINILPNSTVNLTINITNTGTTPFTNYPLLLYTTPGLTLARDKQPHYLYTPLLTQTLSLAPGQLQQIVVPLYVLAGATSLEAIILVYQRDGEGRPGRVLLRQEISITGAPPSITVLANYSMPTAPQVSCTGAMPALSYIGGAVSTAIAGAYYSTSTKCNKFAGDWLLDVPNVMNTTPVTTAEDFYRMIADLIRQTHYTFSMSTLTFDTHDKSPANQNLVKYYLAPAILELHNKTPVNGPYPLLRFAYSPPANEDETTIEVYEEVFEDLTANLPNPNLEPWRVSIAIAGIGKLPENLEDAIEWSQWNHSKVAVSDYQHAIIGGMNWDLDYVNPVDVDDNGLHEPTIVVNGTSYNVSRLYDLSIKIEGEAAKEAGEFFDLLWRRNIEPIAVHLSDDCITSWYWFGNFYDCPLDAVRNYAPSNIIPNYAVQGEAHNVFGLGRGNQGWGIGDIDYSADEAILESLNVAQENIYISQHQLSNPKALLGYYADEVINTLVKSIVDREVNLNIILSEPWGSLRGGPISEVYSYLDDKLYNYAQAKSNSQQQTVNEALCRLEFGSFRVPTANSDQYIFYTHNKFLMIDEMAFYVGSQNLYPSGFRSSTPGKIIDLNEYGLFVDDFTLAQQVKVNYWQPIWTQIKSGNRVFRSRHLPSDYQCQPDAYRTFLPIISKLEPPLITNLK